MQTTHGLPSLLPSGTELASVTSNQREGHFRGQAGPPLQPRILMSSGRRGCPPTFSLWDGSERAGRDPASPPEHPGTAHCPLPVVPVSPGRVRCSVSPWQIPLGAPC